MKIATTIFKNLLSVVYMKSNNLLLNYGLDFFLNVADKIFQLTNAINICPGEVMYKMTGD